MQLGLSRLCMVMVAMLIITLTIPRYVAPDDARTDQIAGFFRVSSRPEFEANETADLEVINVGDGSGTAVLKSPSTFELDAGSTGNTIQIDFTTPGTMDGGQVLLEMPPG